MSENELEDRLGRALGSAISFALQREGIGCSHRPTWRVMVAYDDEQGRTELDLAHSLVDPPVPAPGAS